MADQQHAHDHGTQAGDDGATPQPAGHGAGGEGDGHGMGERGVGRMHAMHQMTDHERHEMMRMHHRRTLWIWWTIVLLGAWLVMSPLTFDYHANLVTPANDRWTPLPASTNATVLAWSDIICGALLIMLGWRTLTPGRTYSQWAACFVGIWLQFAPLLFWAPKPFIYYNDTIVGVLVIALTILISGMPGMLMMMRPGPTTPPGWSYNPSSWPQRWIMIVLGFFGWMVSRYLAAFQLGYIDHAWDPFFGESTRMVLTSRMSEMWPISDGGLGATSYTFEFLMAYMGSPARWRTMPWMVLIFGILVIPLGLVHVLLVISQPVVVGHWCTLCLLAAGIMLPMIPLEIDEVVAMLQFMRKAVKRDGKPFWRTFWKGDTIDDAGMNPDERSPELASFPDQPLAVTRAATWGVSVPWTLALTTLIGLWLMFAPAVFGAAKPASDSDRLAGALIVVVSVCAMAEVIRTGRLLNVLLGLWLVIGTWFLSGSPLGAQLNSAICGAAVAALSVPRGKVLERYDAWQPYIV